MSVRKWTREAEAAAGLAALRRARVRAEDIARATGTLLVFAEGGRVVFVEPRPAAEARPVVASVTENESLPRRDT